MTGCGEGAAAGGLTGLVAAAEAQGGYPDVLASSVWNPMEPAAAPRPGRWELAYVSGLSYGDGSLVVPMPEYSAGHSVSHHAPGELREDVEAFLSGTLPQ